MSDDNNPNFSDDCIFMDEYSDTELPFDNCLNSFLSKDNTNSTNLLFDSNERNSNRLQAENHQKNDILNINFKNPEKNIMSKKQYTKESIFQHIEIENKNNQIPKTSKYGQKKDHSLMNNSQRKIKKIKRKRVELTKKALEFRSKYYLIFTGYKKFPEKFVIGIHNTFLNKYFDLPRVERYQYRSINNYFQCYCKDSDKILQYLMINKTIIQLTFPELINNRWRRERKK